MRMSLYICMLSRRTQRFIRYSLVGTGTFVIDLALLYFFIETLGMHYLVATAVAFLLAVSVHYAISRVWVFPHTKRGVRAGYAFFIQFAILGMLATTGFMWLLTVLFALPILYTRVLVSVFVGIGNYLANLHLNFKVAGIHKPEDHREPLH
jgi:putative flippase GtrA